MERQKQQSPHEAGFVEVLGGTQSIEPRKHPTVFAGVFRVQYFPGYTTGYKPPPAGRGKLTQSGDFKYCSGQLIPDTTLSFFLGPRWSQPIVELMRPNPVVAMHQKMADIALCFLRSSIAHGRYPFCFQAAKYALHWCVIPAVSSSTHALAHAVSPQPLAKESACILRSLVRVE